MEIIAFSDKWEEEKINSDELFREIISYDIGNNRADMMAVIESDGCIRVYNMDGNYFYDKNNNGNKIPEDILKKLIDMAMCQIKEDYEGQL